MIGARLVCVGGRVRLCCDQPADFYAVVSEDSVAAPRLGPVDAVHETASPAVASLDSRDATLAAGAPFDQFAKAGPAFDGPAGGALASLAHDGHSLDAELLEIFLHFCFAVASIGGHRSRCPADQFLDPFDGRLEQRPVGRVAHMHAVIQHDPVDVVDDLAEVAELDRLADPTFLYGSALRDDAH